MAKLEYIVQKQSVLLKTVIWIRVHSPFVSTWMLQPHIMVGIFFVGLDHQHLIYVDVTPLVPIQEATPNSYANKGFPSQERRDTVTPKCSHIAV